MFVSCCCMNVGHGGAIEQTTTLPHINKQYLVVLSGTVNFNDCSFAVYRKKCAAFQGQYNFESKFCICPCLNVGLRAVAGMSIYVLRCPISAMRRRVRHGGWSRPWRSHTQRGNFRGNRHHFQCFAAAAISAETGGPARSFGFPRRDHSGFLAKLKEIWDVLKD